MNFTSRKSCLIKAVKRTNRCAARGQHGIKGSFAVIPNTLLSEEPGSPPTPCATAWGVSQQPLSSHCTSQSPTLSREGPDREAARTFSVGRLSGPAVPYCCQPGLKVESFPMGGGGQVPQQMPGPGRGHSGREQRPGSPGSAARAKIPTTHPPGLSTCQSLLAWPREAQPRDWRRPAGPQPHGQGRR